MKLRACLRILVLLAVASITWAAASPPAVAVVGEFLPLCNCDDDGDCPGSFCGFDDCVPNGGKVEVCD